MVGVVEWVMVGIKNEKVVGVINRVEWVKNGKIFKIGGGNGGGNEIDNFHFVCGIFNKTYTWTIFILLR